MELRASRALNFSPTPHLRGLPRPLLPKPHPSPWSLAPVSHTPSSFACSRQRDLVKAHTWLCSPFPAPEPTMAPQCQGDPSSSGHRCKAPRGSSPALKQASSESFTTHCAALISTQAFFLNIPALPASLSLSCSVFSSHLCPHPAPPGAPQGRGFVKASGSQPGAILQCLEWP